MNSSLSQIERFYEYSCLIEAFFFSIDGGNQIDRWPVARCED